MERNIWFHVGTHMPHSSRHTGNRFTSEDTNHSSYWFSPSQLSTTYIQICLNTMSHLLILKFIQTYYLCTWNLMEYVLHLTNLTRHSCLLIFLPVQPVCRMDGSMPGSDFFEKFHNLSVCSPLLWPYPCQKYHKTFLVKDLNQNRICKVM